jgi:hypothetical protein
MKDGRLPAKRSVDDGQPRKTTEGRRNCQQHLNHVGKYLAKRPRMMEARRSQTLAPKIVGPNNIIPIAASPAFG